MCLCVCVCVCVSDQVRELKQLVEGLREERESVRAASVVGEKQRSQRQRKQSAEAEEKR